MMITFFRYSPHTRIFINLIIILLWILCIGTPVRSRYFAPHSISPEGGCDSSDDALDDTCSDVCHQMGFPAVNTGLPVPMMIHLCVDNICYCSTQNDNNQFAWTKGRVITGYDCELNIPAEAVDKKYEYQHCFIECTSFGYKQETIDKFDSSMPDIALIFNLVVDNDCCCAGKPQFSNDRYELPDENAVKTDESEEFGLEEEDSEIGEEQDFSTVFGESQGDMINGFGEFGSSGGFQYSSSGDVVHESGGEQPSNIQNTTKRKRIETGWYPGKDFYGDEGPEEDPVRESSESAAKRAKRDNVDDQLVDDEGESTTITQTPDVDG